MAQIVRETRTVESGTDQDLSSRPLATTAATGDKTGAITASRVIYFIAGVITGLLALRFVLALLGANPNNAFANFIYSITNPMVAPFANLFNYDTQLGVSRFELETLVAMAVYALIAWMLVKFITTVTNTDEDAV